MKIKISDAAYAKGKNRAAPDRGVKQQSSLYIHTLLLNKFILGGKRNSHEPPIYILIFADTFTFQFPP